MRIRVWAAGGQLVPIRGPFEFDVVDVWGDGKGKAVAFAPRHAPDELYLAFRGVRNEMELPPSAPSPSEPQAESPAPDAGGGDEAAAAAAAAQQQQEEQRPSYDAGPGVDRSNFVRMECEVPAWLAGTALKVRMQCMCSACVLSRCVHVVEFDPNVSHLTPPPPIAPPTAPNLTPNLPFKPPHRSRCMRGCSTITTLCGTRAPASAATRRGRKACPSGWPNGSTPRESRRAVSSS